MAVRVELELDDGSFTTRMVHAGESVAQFRQQVNGTIVAMRSVSEVSQTFLGTLRDITLTLGMARAAFETVRGLTTGWAGDIVKVNAEMERLKTLLAGMSRAADPMKDAANQVKFLRDFAKEAPFSLKELTDTFVKMKSTGLDPMAGGFKAMVDAVAAFGGTDDVLKRATIAIQQMSGKGVIQMEELRQQLGEAMPRAVEIMARSMGVSIPQLIQDIGKGTLDAKTSLNAFFLELDRTFGGTAQRQMNTFNGMVSKTQSLMQSLALTIGESGFYDAVKSQLKDFNDALGGDALQGMAVKLGQGLGQLVNSLAHAVQTAMEFKNEILNVGIAIAEAFAISKTAAIFGGFVNWVTEARASMAGFGLILNNTFRPLMGAGGMMAGIRSLSDLMTGLSLAGAGLGQTLLRLGPMFVAFAAFVESAIWPITLIGVAIYALWTAFSSGANASQSAYDNLVKFGAETQKQVDEANKYVDVLEKRAKALKDLKAAQEEASQNGEGGGVYIDDAQIKKADNDVLQAKQNVADAQVNVTKRTNQRLIAADEEYINDRIAQLKKNRDQAEIESSTEFTARREKMIKANQDTSVMEAAHNQEKRARDLAYYQAEQELFGGHLLEMQMAARDGDKNSMAILNNREQAIYARMAENSRNIEATQKQALGPVTNDKAIDIQKLIEKAKQKLDEMNSSLAGQKAELEGVSGEYAKMAYLIEQSASKSDNMWRVANPDLAKYVDMLRQAQIETDKVTQQLNAKNSLDSDLVSTEADLRKQIYSVQHDGKDALDGLAAKAASGAYSGLTPLQRMMKGWGDVSSEAVKAGTAMETAFGSGMQTKGEGLIGIVERLSQAWQDVRNGASGIGAGAGQIKPGTSTYQIGSSYADNLIRRESGNDPNRRNDHTSAMGLGQFIEGTWMDFIKEIHPEILQAGRDQALAMRADPKLNKEAVNWYGAHNANTLENGGVTPTDANLYLAHFLGPAGALSALTKPDDTLLSSVKGLDKGRASNPDVFKDLITVGDLKSWSQSFMGPMMTASRTGANTDSAGVMMGVAGTPQERAAISNIQLLQDKLKQLTWDKGVTDQAKEFTAEITKANSNIDGTETRVAKLKSLIQSGAFGPDVDAASARYKQVMDLAQKADDANEVLSKRKKTREEADNIKKGLPDREAELQAQQEEFQRRLQPDDGRLKFSEGYMRDYKNSQKQIQSLNEDAANNPANAGANAAAADKVSALNDSRRNREVENAVLAEKQKTDEINKSAMTESEARKKTLADGIARNEEYLNQFRGSEQERQVIAAQVSRNIAALRKQEFNATPFGSMLKQYSDFSGNMEKASTSWMGNFNDRLTDLVMKGQTNWRALTLSIMQDIIKITLQAGESQLFKGILGMGGFSFGGFGGGGMGATDGIGGFGPTAFHHTGGIAGSIMPYKNMPMSLFANATRYHTGGTVGLDPGEVPIIAKQGEEVGWPAQMAAKYGGAGGGSQIVMGDINVHPGTTNGSPAQNKDLAEQIGVHVQAAAQAMVGKELRNQMRPGGMLSTAVSTAARRGY